MTRFITIAIMVLTLGACGNPPDYRISEGPMVIRVHPIGFSKQMAIDQFGVPQIAESDRWYYFGVWYPGGSLGELRFSEKGSVVEYRERYWDESEFNIWIPKLIMSLNGKDERVVYAAGSLLNAIFSQYYVVREARRKSKVPLGTHDFKSWADWWDHHGSYLH